MKISVIVPAYNAEKTISRCLDSILNQNFDDFEIIIINDGSNDGTEKILNQYIHKDSRVKVINKKNAGVSSARNDGLNKASGEFILFVDSDDYIEQNALGLVLENIKDKHDAVLFGYKLKGNGNWGNDNHVLSKLIDIFGRTISSKTILEHVITINPNEEILGYSVRYLFKKSIIDEFKIRFDTSLKISEDYKFIVEFLHNSNYVYILDEELYIYDVNDYSSTSKYMPSLNEDMYKVNKWIEINIYKGNKYIQKEHKGCIANTYLNHVQNIAKIDSGFSVVNGIKNIYKIKKDYNYNEDIKFTVKNLKCRKKAYLAFILFSINLDFIYFILFYIRKRVK